VTGREGPRAASGHAEVNTPGLFGYVLGVAASIPLYGALVAVAGGGGPLQALFAALVVTAYGWPLTLPVGIAGALVVHAVCHRVHAQRVHVAVAFGCGVAGGALVTRSVGAAVLVGVAAAMGRTLVVPLVDRRRAGTDHDFPATR
jgi:hypothetical protein